MDSILFSKCYFSHEKNPHQRQTPGLPCSKDRGPRRCPLTARPLLGPRKEHLPQRRSRGPGIGPQDTLQPAGDQRHMAARGRAGPATAPQTPRKSQPLNVFPFLYASQHASRMVLPALSPSPWALRGGDRALWVWEDSFPNSLCGFLFSVTHCGTWQPRICEKMDHVGYPFTQLSLSHVVPRYHCCHLGRKPYLSLWLPPRFQ